MRHKALRSTQRGKPKATQPNEYWGIDMTKFILGSSGWCYFIVVLDWYTKEIVGRLCSAMGSRAGSCIGGSLNLNWIKTTIYKPNEMDYLFEKNSIFRREKKSLGF